MSKQTDPRYYYKTVITKTKIKLANELNPSGQIFSLDNMYNLSAELTPDTKMCWGGYNLTGSYGFDREMSNLDVGDGVIWTCLDCNHEFTMPELHQYQSPEHSGLECCLDCSAKPKLMCSCGKNEKYYHSDKECNECRNKHNTSSISIPYSNGACASILRMN